MIERFCHALAIVCLFSAPAMAATVSMTVCDPGGVPVAGATVAIVPPGRFATVTDGLTLDEDPSYVRAKTDASGAATVTSDAENFLVFVLHERGYAMLDRATAEQTKDLTLTAWGRVEGEMKIGAKAAADEPVTAWLWSDNVSSSDDASPKFSFSSKATTDAGGKFVIEHLPAGRINVAPNHKWWNRGPIARPLTVVDISAGQTAHVTLGGRGRPLVGKVNVPAALAARDDWQFAYCILFASSPAIPSPLPDNVKSKSLQEQASWWQSFRGTDREKTYRAAQAQRTEQLQAATSAFEIARDGTFRIEDISPGSYDLRFEVLTTLAPGKASENLGDAKVEIEVAPFPGERTDEPQQLPPIELDTRGAINAGDVVPDFSVPAFDGSTIKLADYRGKFVVLDFWATWCGPCMAELPHMIAAHQKLAGDDRVVMISLSLDNEPDAPMQLIAKEKMDWKQGFLGEWEDDTVSKAYGVSGIPSLWLIGSDGKVISRSLRGEELITKVEEAVN